MSKSILVIDTPETCGDCPLCIHTAEEKRYIGYCHTSDEDYYCKALDRYMEYDEVDGGVDILGRPIDCPLLEGKRGRMTYADIYEEFCKKFPNIEADDFRPAIPMFVPHLTKGIPYAIVVWLKDGGKMIYIAESEVKS